MKLVVFLTKTKCRNLIKGTVTLAEVLKNTLCISTNVNPIVLCVR